MKSKFLFAIPVVAGLMGLSMPAQSQTVTLVNVDLRNANILNNLARNLSVRLRDIPITVQVPVSVAANVCQVQAAILANAATRGGSNCYAQNTSPALVTAIQKVMALQ